MQNTKNLKQEKINLKERKKMKKIISSVLVFALMGVPVVSGAFANKEEQVKSIASLSLEAKESEKTAMKVSEKFNRVKEILSKSKGKLTMEDRNTCVTELYSLVQEANKNGEEEKAETLKKILDDILAENDGCVSEKNDKKSKMSVVKKLLIATVVIGVIVAGGYAAYTYCPAVQEFINNKTLPLLKELKTQATPYVNKAKDYVSPYLNKAAEYGTKAFNKACENKYVNAAVESLKDCVKSFKARINGETVGVFKKRWIFNTEI